MEVRISGINQKPESAELENLTAVLNAESGGKWEEYCNFF